MRLDLEGDTVADTATKLNEAAAKAEKAMEEEMTKLVGTESFARLLAETMSSSMGLFKLSSDAFEGGLRALRLPTHGELTRIAGLITRLEDKMEDVLEAVERLEQRLDAQESPRRTRANGKTRP